MILVPVKNGLLLMMTHSGIMFTIFSSFIALDDKPTEGKALWNQMVSL